ncbi:hypothetical protein BH11PAT2_BH11PAT2_04210 [soil metagenome]
MKKKKNLGIWVVFAAVVILLLSWNRIFPSKQDAIVTNPTDLPGIQTGLAPWDANLPTMLSRLKAIGLTPLPMEGNVMHIHQHLDMNINGEVVTLPAGIGISEFPLLYSPLHVHDTTGIIHVESNVVRTFTLGQVFDVWGVLLTNDCIGGYCADATHSLKVYSNGTLYTGNPNDLVLTQHQEIMIVYGDTASTTPPIISSYEFPAGY